MTYYLVVEDDPTIRNLLIEILDVLDTGQRFVFLEGSEDAHHWLENAKNADSETLPEAIFIDVRASNQQGADIARQIRNHPTLSRMYIVLVLPSGLSREELDALTWRAGADRLIFSSRREIRGLNRIVEELMLTVARREQKGINSS